MNVSVFGLGYVGSVSAASFAADGHDVVGVDVNPAKVESINEGRSPIVEPGLDELMREAHAGRPPARHDRHGGGRARDRRVARSASGTPSRKNGSLDLIVSRTRLRADRRRARDQAAYHVVVVRSTVLPGTTHEVVIPALERRSGKKYGEGFGVSVNPEFLREGTALARLPAPAADARRPQPRGGRERHDGALRVGRRRRSSRRASASPR